MKHLSQFQSSSSFYTSPASPTKLNYSSLQISSPPHKPFQSQAFVGQTARIAALQTHPSALNASPLNSQGNNSTIIQNTSNAMKPAQIQHIPITNLTHVQNALLDAVSVLMQATVSLAKLISPNIQMEHVLRSVG